ncbi:MAG: lipid A deacylase LpxR family protein [Gammaproteobacteria bacterium]
MSTSRRHAPRIPLLTMFVMLAVSALARGEDSAFDVLDAPLELPAGGVSFQLDNDLFSGEGRDRDYSWGLAVTFASPEPGRFIAPVDRVRGQLASWLPRGTTRPSHVSRASQLGILAMTPEDLTISGAQSDDRPYASVVFLTSAETRVMDNAGRARFTSFTVGALGLGAAELGQRAVHEVVGGEVPNGWEHQISEGGEPTARFVYAEQWLVRRRGRSDGLNRETKLTLGGSAGYLTEGSASISMRWGRIRTPWWSFNPELGDYGAAPIAPITGFGIDAPPEIYGFAGTRVKARAYNALLQGQFRHSDVRVASEDIARFQAEAWAGIASNWSDWRVTYSMHVASRELTPEPAARTLVWASVSVERAF